MCDPGMMSVELTFAGLDCEVITFVSSQVQVTPSQCTDEGLLVVEDSPRRLDE